MPGRLEALAGGLRSGRIRVPIQDFGLRDSRRAHELLESGSSTGKLVLRVT
jgi:NADPH:quinone reductase-like Zn-dependent oxidoreductase